MEYSVPQGISDVIKFSLGAERDLLDKRPHITGNSGIIGLQNFAVPTAKATNKTRPFGAIAWTKKFNGDAIELHAAYQLSTLKYNKNMLRHMKVGLSIRF